MNRSVTVMLLILWLSLGRCTYANEAGCILIVVGPTNHPPGTHEVAAGGRLMKYCLENMEHKPDVKVEVVYEWPDAQLRESATSIVFIGDTFPANRFPNAPRNLAELNVMMSRGCGIVCVHYATGLLGEDVQHNGDHPLLRWMGGYFANRSCPHHESFAKIFSSATIQPAAAQHAIWRGCREFTLNDEPYTNNYFGSKDNQPAANVTVLATSMLPPENPKTEAVSWCVQRSDGGRGFAVVMPHFYRSWKNEDLRRFILNGIVWSANQEIPPAGVRTTLPALSTFRPEALEPPPQPPKVKPTTAQQKASSQATEANSQTASPIDLSHWKLTLPIRGPEPDSSPALEVSAEQLAAGYQHADYFRISPSAAIVFWCPVNGATTKNTKYPRTELREVVDPMNDNVCWSARGTHELTARCRVVAVPSTQKVIIGQIHGYTGQARPLVKLQFNKGRIEALVKESISRNEEIKLAVADIRLNNEFDFAIRLRDGTLSVTVNGDSQSVNIFDKDPTWAEQSLYFKAGAYTQDNDGPATEGAQIEFTKLSVSHSQKNPT